MKNTIGETLITRDNECPHCGYKVDRATRLADARVPRPGDIAICMNCGEFNQFGEQLELVKAPNEADLLLALTDETRQFVITIRETLKQRGKFK
jgi:DNA-directed RNA polymerase subunit RPC12/RpoP